MAGLVYGDSNHASDFRRIVFLLVTLVIVPTSLLLVVGTLMLVFWKANLNILFGILVVTLVGCVVTGVVLALVFLRRQANLAKLQTDFVSKVSHELRTPLTSIRMFAEMLRTEQDPAKVELCLDVLQKETTRLSDRIERLLDWGRMEAGRRIYERKPESVADIVADAVAAFETATIGRGQEIEVDVADDVPAVIADRGAVSDALVNLLSNAWKYAGEDCRIQLSVRRQERFVRIAVTDDGPGIPTKEQRRIFEKFYRLDDRLAREVEGSGLGLAIVRHVARGHGGRIEVESEPGKGSTFTIILPVARDELSAAAEEPAVAS